MKTLKSWGDGGSGKKSRREKERDKEIEKEKEKGKGKGRGSSKITVAAVPRLLKVWTRFRINQSNRKDLICVMYVVSYFIVCYLRCDYISDLFL